MRVVVKLGGAALEEPRRLDRCAQALAGLCRPGRQVAVVHGGGAALSRTLAQLGKASEFVGGLRVTDRETRDVALMVLAGMVNKRLVAALARAGQAAVGLSGGDGGSFRARKVRRNGCDLGFVGEISEADPGWIEAIWERGALPVLSSLALGREGEYYNINADQMAAACAVACRAQALVFLTDVPGVWDRDHRLLRRLTRADVVRLVDGEAVCGGMLPKLEACERALAGGVSQVRILPAAAVERLAETLAGSLEVGTEVVAA